MYNQTFTKLAKYIYIYSLAQSAKVKLFMLTLTLVFFTTSYESNADVPCLMENFVCTCPTDIQPTTIPWQSYVTVVMVEFPGYPPCPMCVKVCWRQDQFATPFYSIYICGYYPTTSCGNAASDPDHPFNQLSIPNRWKALGELAVRQNLNNVFGNGIQPCDPNLPLSEHFQIFSAACFDDNAGPCPNAGQYCRRVYSACKNLDGTIEMWQTRVERIGGACVAPCISPNCN